MTNRAYYTVRTTPMTEPAPPAYAICDDLLAVHADLIGSYAGRAAPDAPNVLSLPLSRWYLSGSLAPALLLDNYA